MTVTIGGEIMRMRSRASGGIYSVGIAGADNKKIAKIGRVIVTIAKHKAWRDVDDRSRPEYNSSWRNSHVNHLL
jgi:hypothetical protein